MLVAGWINGNHGGTIAHAARYAVTPEAAEEAYFRGPRQRAPETDQSQDQCQGRYQRQLRHG